MDPAADLLCAHLRYFWMKREDGAFTREVPPCFLLCMARGATAPSPSLSIPSENGGNGGRQESGLVNLAHEMMPSFSSRAERGKAQ